MNTLNNYFANSSQIAQNQQLQSPSTAAVGASPNIPIFQNNQSPLQSKILSPNVTQRVNGSGGSLHQKSNSIGGSSQPQQTLAELQRQKYIMQQSSLYAKSGKKFKTSASTLNNQKLQQSSNSNGSHPMPSMQFENLNWVFLKNDNIPGTGVNISNVSKNLINSVRKKKSSKKELNHSAVVSDNTSLDSPGNHNDRSSLQLGGAGNFAELLSKHQHQPKEESLIEADLTQLQEYQQHYNIEDDDSPSMVLEKIQHQVHDQMCPGFHINKSKTNNNDNSFDSKNNFNNNNNNSISVSMNQENVNNTVGGSVGERIPKINGFSAKIKQVNSVSNQNSARHSGNSSLNGSTSNFQSFKKNAMKLPKVNQRTSLLNFQITTNQKVSSLPISPRIFESAKFGNSYDRKKSQNDSGFAGQGDNSLCNQGAALYSSNGSNHQQQPQPFALPFIDKTTQQSTNYFDQSNGGLLDNLMQPSLQHTQGSSILGLQNRGSIHRGANFNSGEVSHYKQASQDGYYESTMGELSTQDQLLIAQSTIQTTSTAVNNQTQQQQDSSSFMLTETKIELYYKQRFTLNALRAKVLQSPSQQYQLQQHQQQLQQHRNSSTGSYKNVALGPLNDQSAILMNAITLSKIQKCNHNSSAILVNTNTNSNNTSQATSPNPLNGNNILNTQPFDTNIGQKMCSSCHKEAHHKQKKFSFDFNNIEMAKQLNKKKKQMKNNSYLSDGQAVDDSQDNIMNYSLLENEGNNNAITNGFKLRELNLPKGSHTNVNNSMIDYDTNPSQLKTPNYNTFRDNNFFNKFAIKYNQKLISAFEEVDKLNNNSSSQNNSSSLTLKQDVLAYMEQHSEIRRLMKEEALKNATPIGKNGKIKKIMIKKQQLQQFYDSNGHNNNSNDPVANNQLDLSQIQEEHQSTKASSGGKLKLERMKNYGRWYLKPQEFNRIVVNKPPQQPNINDDAILTNADNSATMIDDMTQKKNSSFL